MSWAIITSSAGVYDHVLTSGDDVEVLLIDYDECDPDRTEDRDWSYEYVSDVLMKVWALMEPGPQRKALRLSLVQELRETRD